jgi:CBS domain-containing protein
MQVKEIMSKHVTWARPTMTLQEAAKKMRDQYIGCLPVRKDGSLVGMITDRDIVCRAVAKGDGAGKATIASAMSKSVTTCFDDQSVEEAARLFEKQQIYRLPVLNRKKQMVGILSLSDLALHAPHKLTGEVLEAVSQRSQ